MKAINIIWDTDGEDVILPNEIEIPYEMIDEDGMIDEDEVSDYISDKTGFCHYGFEIEKIPQFEVVCVAALSGGRIVTCTSCYRKDAQHYASYYRSIGYNSRVLTYDELETLEEKIKEENRYMQERMLSCQ